MLLPVGAGVSIRREERGRSAVSGGVLDQHWDPGHAWPSSRALPPRASVSTSAERRRETVPPGSETRQAATLELGAALFSQEGKLIHVQ